MLYEVSNETITAIKNVTIHIEELYDSRRVVDADDIIMLQSIKELNKIVEAWEHQEELDQGLLDLEYE